MYFCREGGVKLYLSGAAGARRDSAGNPRATVSGTPALAYTEILSRHSGYRGLPRFSANVSTLFTEAPLLERFECARRAGFDAVEIQFPYDLDPGELKTALDDCSLPLALINFPAGDLLTGGEGYAAISGRDVELAEALEQGSEFARLLRPRAMHLLAGCPAAARDRDECRRVFAASLDAAGASLEGTGVRLVVEAINDIDWPGYLLPRAAQVLDLIDHRPQIELEFDVFHARRMGDDPLPILREHIDRIGHIQFADHPGRGEPGSGNLDFAELFALIDALPYAGYVGAEYFPSTTTEATLDWLRRYRASR